MADGLPQETMLISSGNILISPKSFPNRNVALAAIKPVVDKYVSAEEKLWI